jgi:hypothetical protein
MKRVTQVIALAAVTGSLSVAAWAGPDDAAKPAQNSSEMSALRVVRDPATGELRAPNDQELRALIAAQQQAKALRQSARTRAAQHTAQEVMPTQKHVVRHANGMASVKLSQESLTAIKAQTTANGVKVVHVEQSATAPRMEK